MTDLSPTPRLSPRAWTNACPQAPEVHYPHYHRGRGTLVVRFPRPKLPKSPGVTGHVDDPHAISTFGPSPLNPPRAVPLATAEKQIHHLTTVG